MRNRKDKKYPQETNLKLCSQIDFIRLLKNADDHESMIKLASLKENMNQLTNFRKEKNNKYHG